MMKIKSFLKQAFPRPIEMIQSRRFYRREMRSGERELRYLSQWVDARVAVDVGANNGTYAYHLSKLTRVVAFEPNPRYRWRLSNLPDNVQVHDVAVSDHDGTATLHIPSLSSGEQAHGWATLEDIPGTSEFNVIARTLDSFNLDPCFIKVDVEGHEEAVIRGALQTIRRSKPVLLIECEERHNLGVTTRLPTLLKEEGYDGFFYLPSQEKTPISEFDSAIHQPMGFNFETDLDRVRQSYVNNFLFLPSEKTI